MSSIEIYKYPLGKGAFGEVFLGRLKDSKTLIAVKRESKKTEQISVLVHENHIIQRLNLSIAFWEDRNYYYMAMPLHGPSLDSLQKNHNGRFSLKTCLFLGINMISIIEKCHNQGILHRDIKPANFLIDYHLPHKHIYLIDFGLAKSCIQPNGKHIPFQTKVQRVGSLRYMSKYVHKALESSYRDDIYSIGYVLIYLFLNDLPWRASVKDLNMIEKHKKILALKEKISNSRLVYKLICDKCNNPTCSFIKCMLKYFDYADSLEFGQTVNYNIIISWFNECLTSHGFKAIDGINSSIEWDWIH